MTRSISRAAYADMFGATTVRQRASRRHSAGRRGREGFRANDIYSKEDTLILTRAGRYRRNGSWASKPGAVHTRRSARTARSISRHGRDAQVPEGRPDLIESGGDHSPELADLTIYVIDVAQGEKIPRKGGGITRSDPLVKSTSPPQVGASLEVMERHTRRMCNSRPFAFTNLRSGQGVAEVAKCIENTGGLILPTAASSS